MTKFLQRERCSIAAFSAGRLTPRCNELAVLGKMFCALHLAEAMARMEKVRDDRVRPWPDTPTATQRHISNRVRVWPG